MVRPLVKPAEVRGADLDRKKGERNEGAGGKKRRGTSEHLYLAQHRGLADCVPPTPLPATAGGEAVTGPLYPSRNSQVL